jgi:sugar lactone lactonase YvrE
VTEVNVSMIFRLPARAAAVVLAAVTAATAAAPARAAEPDSGHRFPTTINLPTGFQPEGIAIGPGPVAYFGSRATGVIFRVDLATGAGRELSPATGTSSLGLKTDRRGRLFVSGGRAGDARVVDTRTGAVLARYQFATTPPNTFVNDVILTPRAAYFTDSNRAVLYALPLGRHGELPPATGFRTIPLTGAIVVDPAAVNANGIARTPDGRGLLIIQSNTGLLFRVDPATGATTAVDVGGVSLVNGDGLLLLGRTLYVVQNRLNVVTVLRLNAAGTAGRVVDHITDPRFDVPTTVAAFRDRLYLPNARFGVPMPDAVAYTAVAVPQHS